MAAKVVLACPRSFRIGALRNAFWLAPPSAAKAGGNSDKVFQREYIMHKKALTVAIAGALAAPMAAQAVDFTLSGQVSRTLFVTDSDAGTSGEIRDNNGATRVRANGHSVLEDGSTLGIQFEYTVGSGPTLPTGAPTTNGDSINLRHANVQYTNSVAGRITFGQGFEAGEGSSYLGPGVTGLGAGQDGTSMGAYFSSLDGGGRTNMVRYDTPTLGPLRAAVSLGNDDSVSALLALSSEFGGTTFGAQVGTHHMPRPAAPSTRDPSQVSASFGVTLASGLSIGGAWGRGDDLAGMAATPATTVNVQGSSGGALAALNTALGTSYQDSTVITTLTPVQLAALMTYANAPGNSCDMSGTPATIGAAIDACTTILLAGATQETSVDPSYVRMGIGYTFGNTTVAASWYNSEDFVVDGSEGTAFGIGASHALPKAGTTLHVSVQNYDVERPMMPKMDETVFQLGALVTF